MIFLGLAVSGLVGRGVTGLPTGEKYEGKAEKYDVSIDSIGNVAGQSDGYDEILGDYDSGNRVGKNVGRGGKGEGYGTYGGSDDGGSDDEDVPPVKKKKMLGREREKGPGYQEDFFSFLQLISGRPLRTAGVDLSADLSADEQLIGEVGFFLQ